ncbi:DUF5011 domain-containing protein [Bifidobacterium reuteri]|nr:DUF5011 domain-containing protein [Bifidobacterium reuteri]
MRDRDSVMRGGVKPLWLRLVGVLAALAMLLTGMVATATADAADNASGDVTLDFNGGNYPDSTSKVIKGRLDTDGWAPDLSMWNTSLDLGPSDNVDYPGMKGALFYGWNTDADGTGDWYIFTRTDDGYRADKAPTLANGKLKYPQSGKLYAQYDTGVDGEFAPSQSTVRHDEVKNLTFTLNGKGRSRGEVYVRACMDKHDDEIWTEDCISEEAFHYDQLLYAGDDGAASEPFALGRDSKHQDELNKLFDAAFANPKVKYLNVYWRRHNASPLPEAPYASLGSIEIDHGVAPAPDVTAPVFAGVSDVTVDQGVVFDPLAGVSARDDRDGDVTSAVTVSPSVVDTSRPGETTLTYTVKDKAGNTATVSRVVRVKTVAPDADRDLTGDTRDDGLIGLGVVAPGTKVTLQLPAGYAGRTGDVYVYSDLTVLAVGATVSDDGTLGVALPAGLPAGVHRIVFKPYDASLPLVWDSFEVRAAQGKPVPSTPGKTDATAGKKPAAKQPLPDTGSDVALVGVAVLVLAAVAGIVLAVRRRG